MASFRAVENIPISDRSVVRVSAGAGQIDVRVYEQFAGPAKALTPTKHGVTVPADLIGALMYALEAARDALGGDD